MKAKSQVRIIIEFYPQKTQNYYERVFCVVRNHQILYSETTGSCRQQLRRHTWQRKATLVATCNKYYAGVAPKNWRGQARKDAGKCIVGIAITKTLIPTGISLLRMYRHLIF